MNSRIRLVTFAAAGGTALAFERLRAPLEPHVELVALERPGRGLRRAEALLADFDRIVDDALRQLLATPGPWAFLGHSMGGAIAVEVSRRLDRTRARRDLRHIFVAGALAPWDVHRRRQLHLLDDEALLASLAELGGIPEQLRAETELLELFLPIIRADLLAIEIWRPDPVFAPPCPITAIGGDADSLVPPARVRAWTAHAGVEARAVILPGSHFMLQENVDEVSRLIVSTLLETAA
jgi:surfactin synthase thioesterase subunit